MMYRFVKRLFDILLSSILLLVLSPVFIVLIILVKIKLGSPVFFKQVRSGMNQKKINLIKFRTMTDERDDEGNLLPDDQRMTGFGKFLRSSSLDELPELLSIIVGDMSIIGPRPLPSSYDEYYTERERKRFEVRSGLIPPDSVEASAIISWDKQLEYEARYAEELSFKKDIKILMYAFKIVFTRNETDYGSYVRKSLIEERMERDNEL